jgi:hypothetical protein
MSMKNITIVICILVGFVQSCKSIYFRSKGNQSNTSIYFVNAYQGSCSPYAVEFNDESNSIVEIKNHLVLSSCGKDYMNEEEIGQAIQAYIKYHFFILQVDQEGNVYINPDKQEPPVLLRKSLNPSPKDLEKYEKYKGSWYIRKKQ